ncbi:MAG: AMP-binding protein, partial [Rhodospirillaceae bacterium]|nr:AMP-binding protein [Rhodospirillaceae bacterium]
MQGLMMDVPLLVSSMIDYAAECHGDREVVSRELDGEIHRYSYRDAHLRTKKLAQAMERLGLGQGERVGVLAWNTRQYFEMFYGVPGMGGVLHTINPRLFHEQLVYIANHAEDTWLAFDAACAELVRAMAPELTTVRGYIFFGGRDELPDDLNLSRIEFYEELLAAEYGAYEWPEFDERRASTICYTSGTTGHPKGVVYSHRSMTLTSFMAMAGDNVAGFRAGIGEVFMPMAPLFHGNGWMCPFTAPMMGYKLVLPGREYEPDKLYELMEDEGVTLCFGVPTIWMILLNYLQQQNLTFSHLRATVMSGSKPPRALQESLLKDHGVEPMQGWGMTEALSSTKFSPVAQPEDRSDDEKLEIYQYGG